MVGLAGISEAENPGVTTLRREGAEVSDASQAQATLSDDFDEFMLLFTTQLQNQDPTDPMDTNEATKMIVEFTGVEQAVATNKNLEELIALNSNQHSDSAVSYIGRYIETDGNSGFLNAGKSSFAYDMPAGAQTATITIMDSVGRPVHSQTIETTPGGYSYNWDGVNSFDGTDMPDGVYNFGIAARDIKGELLEAKTFTTGVVTSVALDGPQPVMTLGGGLEVAADKITSVIGIFE